MFGNPIAQEASETHLRGRGWSADPISTEKPGFGALWALVGYIREIPYSFFPSGRAWRTLPKVTAGLNRAADDGVFRH